MIATPKQLQPPPSGSGVQRRRQYLYLNTRGRGLDYRLFPAMAARFDPVGAMDMLHRVLVTGASGRARIRREPARSYRLALQCASRPGRRQVGRYDTTANAAGRMRPIALVHVPGHRPYRGLGRTPRDRRLRHATRKRRRMPRLAARLKRGLDAAMAPPRYRKTDLLGSRRECLSARYKNGASSDWERYHSTASLSATPPTAAIVL